MPNKAEHNLQMYRDFTVNITNQAAEVLKKRAVSSGKLDIEYKDEKKLDLVTQFDKQTEKFLIETLTKQFPDHAIVAEEGGTGAAGTEKNATHRWIIDPIDGTTNFAHGHPFFAISVGLEIEGELVLGVVNAPALNELYIGVKGQGSTLNGAPLQVSKIAALNEALLATGFNPYIGTKNFPHFEYFQLRCPGIRRAGAASLDLCYVAAGRIDGYWEFALNAWDIAAGAIILTEAGGKITNLDGTPLNLFGQSLLATNGLIHEEMSDYFKANLK